MKKAIYILYWSRLSIIEDKMAEAGIIQFYNLLKDYEQKKSDIGNDDLKQASLKLSLDASKYTINVWLDSTERKNYNRETSLNKRYFTVPVLSSLI